MKNIKTLAIVGILSSLFLTGCDFYSSFDGVVVDKYQMQETTYIKSGESLVPMSTTSYKLVVNNDDDKQIWSVKSSVYKNCNTGDSVQRETNGTVICYN